MCPREMDKKGEREKERERERRLKVERVEGWKVSEKEEADKEWANWEKEND